MKKRILSLFCTLCLMFTMLPTTAFAAWAVPTLTVEGVRDGDQIKTTVKIGPHTDMGAINFTLNYDSSKLTLSGNPTGQNFLSGAIIGSVTPGKITPTWHDINATSSATEIPILTATFDIVAGQSGPAVFTIDSISITDKSGDEENTSPGTGSVTTTTVTIPKAPISSVSFTLTDPAQGAALPSLSGLGSGYTGAVEWYEGTGVTGSVVTGNAKPNTKYTAKVTLTANSGESFADSVNAPTGYTKVSNDGNKLVLTNTFPTTGSLPAASVTAAPTAKSGLEYNGSEQGLLGFVGTANGGTMQYSLNGTTWSDTDPKGKNAGDYTVYYKAKGDSSHSDSAVANIQVTIGKKDISGVTIGTIANQPYTGSAITPDPEVKDGTTTLVKGKDYTVSCTDTYVGTATLTITGKGNYTGTKAANFDGAVEAQHLLQLRVQEGVEPRQHCGHDGGHSLF